jgi:NitT/TauT family transport system permease protein
MTATVTETDRGIPDAPSIEAQMAGSVRSARRMASRRRNAVLATQIGVLVAFLGLWQGGADSGALPNATLFYGSPSGVFEALASNWDRLLGSLGATITAAFMGFAVGVGSALVIGVVLTQVPFLARVSDPYITVLTGLPRIALAPLFVLWFGIGSSAKIALAFSLVFFIVLINVLAGFKGVDKDLVVMARSFGATPARVVAGVILPASLPVLFAGLRLGVVFSILGVIAMEMTAAQNGLGLDIVRFGQTMQPNGIFAALVVLAVAMALLNWVLRSLEARLLRWVPERN